MTQPDSSLRLALVCRTHTIPDAYQRRLLMHQQRHETSSRPDAQQAACRMAQTSQSRLSSRSSNVVCTSAKRRIGARLGRRPRTAAQHLARLHRDSALPTFASCLALWDDGGWEIDIFTFLLPAGLLNCDCR